MKNNSRTTFYIVRHGLTDWNIAGKLQGHTDIPLNDTGKEQAALVRDAFNSIEFQVCISSDLQRALETAQIIKGDKSYPLKTDERLRERFYGPLEGRHYSEVRDLLNAPDTTPHIESYELLHQRFCLAIEEIASSHPTANILVVTHGGVMKTFLAKLLKIEIDSPHLKIENTAVLKVTFSEKQYRLQKTDGIHLPTTN